MYLSFVRYLTLAERLLSGWKNETRLMADRGTNRGWTFAFANRLIPRHGAALAVIQIRDLALWTGRPQFFGVKLFSCKKKEEDFR